MSPRPRNDDEHELQILLRDVAAVVLLGLLAVIVIVAVLTPFLSHHDQDTTLLLGLAASIVGAMLTLLGVQVSLRRGGNGNGKE